MCGVAGFIDMTLQRQEACAQLGRMLARIAHRGPDHEGIWQEGPVAIGHRRLSIVDLSRLGHQPMTSASGRYVIALNGEIYNHRALRKEQELRGDCFRGHSDTEVLLALIERQGLAKALQQCLGMFAIVLWDRQERTLQLARDRFGEKPLYYGWQGGSFLWGSELKAMCAHQKFERRLDPVAVEMLLRYSYIPGSLSIFQQTYKLPPAHILRLQLPSDAQQPLAPEPCLQSLEPYWSAQQVSDSGLACGYSGSYEEAVNSVEALLADAVRLQMQADVPLGAFLSGGIDSSLVVALMQKYSASPVRTFAIGFEDETLDEAPAAKSVAAHLGTDHTEQYVSAADALAIVPLLPEIFCEPMADPSQIPTYLVARLARKAVTVSLSGDGGDEMFCGYTKYLAGWHRSKPLGQRVVGRMVRALPPPTLARIRRYALPCLNSILTERRIAVARRRLGARSYLSIAAELATTNADHRQLLQQPLNKLTSLEQWGSRVAAKSSYLRTAMNLDLATYLPHDILVKVDRATMAVSLESRAPMLDHRVFEFTAALPMEFLSDGRQGKRILRDVLYRYVPRSLVDRPKSGFSPPLSRWLRGPLYTWAADLLASSKGPAADLIALPIARALLDGHKNSKRDDLTFQLWPVLSLLAWSQHYLGTQ